MTSGTIRPLQQESALPRFSLRKVATDHVRESFADAVDAGLGAPRKHLPCRYLYDERGSLLFEEITRLEEYYPTRTERAILERCAPQIADSVETPAELVELGSGSAAKTRLLIDALIDHGGHLRFVPIDISASMLEASSRELLDDYAPLEIDAVAGEYEEGLRAIADAPDARPRLVAWLGSSIGNLAREEAAEFLQRVRALLRPCDQMLIGIDLRKDADTLERAYDDERGVTAEFNLNLLARINRELGGAFDLAAFEHRARWCEQPGRVEMLLLSRKRQSVPIRKLGRSYDFEAGEEIHTESAYKYSSQEIDALAARAGLRSVRRWQDGSKRFSLELFAAA